MSQTASKGIQEYYNAVNKEEAEPLEKPKTNNNDDDENIKGAENKNISAAFNESIGKATEEREAKRLEETSGFLNPLAKKKVENKKNLLKGTKNFTKKNKVAPTGNNKTAKLLSQYKASRPSINARSVASRTKTRNNSIRRAKEKKISLSTNIKILTKTLKNAQNKKNEKAVTKAEKELRKATEELEKTNALLEKISKEQPEILTSKEASIKVVEKKKVEADAKVAELNVKMKAANLKQKELQTDLDINKNKLKTELEEARAELQKASDLFYPLEKTYNKAEKALLEVRATKEKAAAEVALKPDWANSAGRHPKRDLREATAAETKAIADKEAIEEKFNAARNAVDVINEKIKSIETQIKEDIVSRNLKLKAAENDVAKLKEEFRKADEKRNILEEKVNVKKEEKELYNQNVKLLAKEKSKQTIEKFKKMKTNLQNKESAAKLEKVQDILKEEIPNVNEEKVLKGIKNLKMKKLTEELKAKGLVDEPEPENERAIKLNKNIKNFKEGLAKASTFNNSNTPEPASEPSSNAPETAPEEVPEPAPEPAPEVVPEPPSEAVPEEVPAPLSEAVPEEVPESAPEAVFEPAPAPEPPSEAVPEPAPAPEPPSEPASEPAPEPVAAEARPLTDLPPGWEEHRNNEGQVYYSNGTTTQWERPNGSSVSNTKSTEESETQVTELKAAKEAAEAQLTELKAAKEAAEAQVTELKAAKEAAEAEIAELKAANQANKVQETSEPTNPTSNSNSNNTNSNNPQPSDEEKIHQILKNGEDGFPPLKLPDTPKTNFEHAIKPFYDKTKALPPNQAYVELYVKLYVLFYEVKKEKIPDGDLFEEGTKTDLAEFLTDDIKQKIKDKVTNAPYYDLMFRLGISKLYHESLTDALHILDNLDQIDLTSEE
jgi:hypothetical protein